MLALIALGEAWEALGEKAWAARAYGSIIDLFPSRADLRRFAGGRLMRLGTGADGALDIVVDTFRHAVAAAPRPPGQPSLPRLRARSARAGPRRRSTRSSPGARARYPQNRFAGVDRILREDVGLIGAAWIRAEPSKRAKILERVRPGRRRRCRPSPRCASC